jgi:hypothetical protein
MLYRLEKLIGASVHASDGEVGKIKDFYFDNLRWTVRYLVLDTGGWLEDRQILISPFTIDYIDVKKNVVYARLSKERIEGSPRIDTDMPVSRQHEVELGTYYGYPGYWGGSMLWGDLPFPQIPADPVMVGNQYVDDKIAQGDPHLHSVNEVIGYHLKVMDGEIGHLQDFLIEEESWAIRYMIVNTRNWWPGKDVVIPPQWSKAIDWSERVVRLDLTQENVKSAPEYDDSIVLSRVYEEKLHQHYDRPYYW